MLELLQAVIAGSAAPGIPAHIAVAKLLTFDARATLDERLFTLAATDRAVFDGLAHSKFAQLTSQPQDRKDCEVLRLFYNALGRLHIRRLDEETPDCGLGKPIEIGFLSLERDLMAQAEARADTSRREELRYRKALEKTLEDEDAAGALGRLLDEVEDSVRHVEAVCFYVDDRFYAVMERFTNLISTRKGLGLIDGLRERPLSQWLAGDRIAIIALRALFLSGRSIRFEEFNSTALTAKRLFERLCELGALYGAAAGEPFVPSPDILELGRQCGALALRVNGDRQLRYRRVNGITFQKTERLAALDDGADADDVVQEAFHALQDKWQYCGEDACAFFSDMAEETIAASLQRADETAIASDSAAASPLEELIEDIVASAVVSTGADYGMSSSLRSPGVLFAGDPALLPQRIAALTTKDFYCCIAATQAFQQKSGVRLSGDVFRAVQARMQYNRWHFLPGNLPRAAIATDRNYFYPPVMPDLAEWVDQFHAGHARAGVRYSIRAPGPEIGQPPLQICGQTFRGFYDVRVVRVEGPPFDLRDLRIVRTHCRWMGFVWQKILETCAGAPDAAFAIKGFANGSGAIITRRAREPAAHRAGVPRAEAHEPPRIAQPGE